MGARDLLHVNDQPGQHPRSYYAATAHPAPDLPPLQGAAEADVGVIGGGYTGLSAALHLAERGYRVTVLEAHRVGWGASGRNGGQLNSGQRRGQIELEALVGLEHARRLWQLAEDAKALVKGLIARHGIQCDLKPGVIDAAHRPRHVPHYRRLVDKLRDGYGYPHLRFLDRVELRQRVGSPAYFGGMLDLGGGHLHPLNYAQGLAAAARAAGAAIHERSEATSFHAGRRCTIETAAGKLRARFVVLACNGYLGELAPAVAARIMPINNFIIATEPLGEDQARALIRDDMAVNDSRFAVNYFRLSADRRLLFGGGETFGWRFPPDIAAFVRPRMLQIFPQLAGTRIDYGWGGTLAITRHRLPHIARLDKAVFAAHGYSGQGVGIATLAGQLIAEAIDGTAGRFDVMAKLPVPSFPGGTLLRWPLLALAMTWYGLRDRL
jgi:gamma-glutamylputrescine oxidase